MQNFTGICEGVQRMNCVIRQSSTAAFMRRVRRTRNGIKMLEFLACVVFLVGGAWLGAMYLGVDFRHVAYTALSESKLLEKVPADWRPPDPHDNGMTREQLL